MYRFNFELNNKLLFKKMRHCFKNPYSCIKFFILLSAVFYLLSVIFSIFLKLNQIDLSDDAFTKKSKCPLCYGNSLCKDIEKFKFLQLESNIIGDDTYLFNKLINIKNVFFRTLQILSEDCDQEVSSR